MNDAPTNPPTAATIIESLSPWKSVWCARHPLDCVSAGADRRVVYMTSELLSRGTRRSYGMTKPTSRRRTPMRQAPLELTDADLMQLAVIDPALEAQALDARKRAQLFDRRTEQHLQQLL